MTDDTQDQEPEIDPETARLFAREGVSPRRLQAMNPGCVFPLIIALSLLGLSLYATVGPNAAISAPQSAVSQSNPQDSALPVIQPSSAGNASSTPAAPSPAPTPTPDNSGQQAPTDQTPTQTPSDQSPGQQASPPPANNTPPPPSCNVTYPSEIDVSGGDPGVLSGGGGNFTATSTDPVLSASVDNCGDGHHFEITWSASGTNADGSTGSANGTDCAMSQFNTTLSNVNPGYAVSVQMVLPVNSCG
ncbi:MAG TPA: hypothetical protein VMR97_12275 [Acidimicrobiales bacterium]|nr:hypothetical protein [Acidimicrobiales bacterium]